MHEDFQTAIRALFGELKLGAPRFQEPGRIRMRIEDLALDLYDEGLGTLVVEGSAGRLSADPVRRADQTRRILSSNLGLLLDSEASVHLTAAAAGETSLAVRAVQTLPAPDVQALIRKIEDVLRTMEYYAPDLKLQTRRDAIPAVRTPPDSFEAPLIFRP